MEKKKEGLRVLVIVCQGHNFDVHLVVFDGAWTKFVAESAIVVSKETLQLWRQVPEMCMCAWVHGLLKTLLHEPSFYECSSWWSTREIM